MNQFLGGKRFIINLFSDHSKNDDGAIGLNSRGYSEAVLPFEFHNNLFLIRRKDIIFAIYKRHPSSFSKAILL